MIQVKEMMQDNDLKNSKSKDKGSKSRSQSMDEQSHYKQDKTITRQSINVKRHIFNVIGDTEKFEERDLNIGGDFLVIPLGIISDIQQLMYGFLWCNGEYKRGRAKVDWDDICLPKSERGLGLRSLEIRNGLSASLWYDRWCSLSPLSRFLSPRDIAREGYTLQACVADLILNGTWNWPQAWLAKAPNIGNIVAPILNINKHDCLKWRDANGNMMQFSIKCAWEVLRPRGMEFPWYNIVWFTHCIPRHAFHLWLVMRRSLKTQDKLRTWDVGPNTDLNLLRSVSVRALANSDGVSPLLQDIILVLQPMGFMAADCFLIRVVYPTLDVIVEDLKRVWFPNREFQVKVVLFFPSLGRFFKEAISFGSFSSLFLAC
ncbi:putative reverse transcriptase domain-containing protein [Tanacetum coccineum]